MPVRTAVTPICPRPLLSCSNNVSLPGPSGRPIRSTSSSPCAPSQAATRRLAISRLCCSERLAQRSPRAATPTASSCGMIQRVDCHPPTLNGCNRPPRSIARLRACLRAGSARNPLSLRTIRPNRPSAASSLIVPRVNGPVSASGKSASVPFRTRSISPSENASTASLADMAETATGRVRDCHSSRAGKPRASGGMGSSTTGKESVWSDRTIGPEPPPSRTIPISG